MQKITKKFNSEEQAAKDRFIVCQQIYSHFCLLQILGEIQKKQEKSIQNKLFY
jgi:hypothetical protein